MHPRSDPNRDMLAALLSVCCMNAQSLNNKALYIADFVMTQSIDIILLSETSLGTDFDHFVISELVPAG